MDLESWSLGANMDNISDKEYFMAPETCYSERDTGVCIRICFLVVLTVVTAVCLVARITQYHYFRNRHYMQYFVLYIGTLITLLLFVHTVYFPHVQFDFTDILLVAIQLLSICLYYTFWACRLLKKESLFFYCVLPFVIVLILLFTVVFVWAAVSAADDSNECTRPQWLIFSASQFTIIQFLLATVIYISCKLNHVRTVKINRWSQKAQLTFIVTVYEIVGIFMLAYDIYLIIAGGRHCQTAISHSKGVLVFMEILLKFLRFLVPQLAIVVIFAPLRPQTIDPDDEIEHIKRPYYYPTKPQTNGGERDPLLYTIPTNHPPLKPSSPEDHYPSLPRHGTYTSTSGYNFYQFKSSNTSTSVN